MKQLVLLGLLGCAHASPPPAASTTVGPNISTLQWYVGDWTCTGTENGKVSTDAPLLQIKVAAAFASWLAIDVYDHGKRVTGEFLGADAKGTFHHVWTDEDGGHGSLAAPGWQGDTLVLENDHPDPAAVTYRMLLKRGDHDHYVHVYEEDKGAGFTPVYTKTCHRA